MVFRERGFTIIELIVVIAIIAVLATIVLVNVTKYINSSKDIAIEDSLHSILLNSPDYYANHSGNFGAFCNDNETLLIYNSINSGNKNCKHTSNTWVVCAQLASNTSLAWCVDYTGLTEQMANSSCTNGLSVCP